MTIPSSSSSPELRAVLAEKLADSAAWRLAGFPKPLGGRSMFVFSCCAIMSMWRSCATLSSVMV